MAGVQPTPGFTRWFCQQIREVQLDEKTWSIVLPFRPLNDQEVVIYLRRSDDGKITISDDGEVFGQMFVNYGFDPDDATNAQLAYIRFASEMHGIQYSNGEFTTSAGEDPHYQYNQVLHFIQAILPAYYTMMVQQKEREESFARKVLKILKRQVPHLEGARHVSFGEVTRGLDFYLKSGMVQKVGRTHYSSNSIDTTVSTWQYIEKAVSGNADFRSDLFPPHSMVEKIAVYDDQIKEKYVKILRVVPGHVLAYPSEIDEIISVLSS